MCLLRRDVRRFPALDAFEPDAVVVRGVAGDGTRDLALDQIPRARLQRAPAAVFPARPRIGDERFLRSPAAEDPAVVADEADTVRITIRPRDFHFRPAGVGEGDAQFPVDVPEAPFGIFRRTFDAHGAALAGVQRPLRDIEVVRPPVGDHPEVVTLHGHPAGTGKDVRRPVLALRVGTEFAIVGEGGAPLPCVPVERFGDGLAQGQVARFGGVRRQPDFDGTDLSESSVADVFDGLPEDRPERSPAFAALLGADVEDPSRSREGFDYRASLGNRHREGFLHVDVLAGERGRDGDFRMAEIRRADQHRVDRRIGQQVAVTGIRLHLRPERRFRPRLQVTGPDPVAIRDGGDDGEIAVLRDTGHIHAAGDPPAPDHADLDFLRRRICPPCRPRNQIRERRATSAEQKIPTRNVHPNPLVLNAVYWNPAAVAIQMQTKIRAVANLL